MMDLNDILMMWKKDAVIDDVCLDDETLKSSKLHAKYLELFSMAKLMLKKKEMEYASMKKDKWLYYNGKMSKDDMDKNKWKYDPFDGLSKPMKSDMDMYYSTDEDLVKIKAQIDYQKTIIETLEEIMGNIRWRHTHVKNILEFKKFTSGM
jgi:hypothetical protein|tara:strand:+ start:1476 stop:1925 length:450 start_codon:yes stop_codon:yes gene_type:complete